MARKNKTSPMEGLVNVIGEIIVGLIYLIYRLILFIYDLITFYTVGYKKKSGIGFLKMYFDKGYYGEFTLFRKLARIISKKQLFTNIYLEGKNTDTTEIDVVAVTNKGIYVFEMKNYGGYIHGSENDTHWTQAFNRKSKYKFYNPLRQNYAHQKALENHLEIDSDKLIPMVVFSKRSKLTKINISDRSTVLQMSKALNKVKRIEKKSNNKISDQEIERYIVKLIDKSLMDEETKQKHINDVKLLASNAE